MLSLSRFLCLEASLRLATLAAISTILSATPAHCQTYSKCNPTEGTCPADTALGKSISVNFASGQSSEFSTSGAPTYDSNGASFTVAKSGDAPTLTSDWYIMFGRYDIVMKAAPGAGIVSSVVLQSDDLDEIDWEWLGAQNDQVQSNYFGKGQTTSTDRSAVLAVSDTQSDFHTYTLIWSSTQVVWQIDGVTARVLEASAADGQFPQTPMQLKIGSWSGGDPSNAAGTIAWADGPTNYADGPFTMVVQSVSVSDASTGSSYSYDGTTGTWGSITSNGGSINGGGTGTESSAPAITSTTSGDAPFDGTHRSSSVTSTPGIGSWQASTTLATTTNTAYPGLPSGWTVNASGKVVPTSVGLSTYPLASSTSSAAASPQVLCSGSGAEELVTTYNEQGFLTTELVLAGTAVSYDVHGFPITPSGIGCTTIYQAQSVVTTFNEGSTLMVSAPATTGSVTALQDTIGSSVSSSASSSSSSSTSKATNASPERQIGTDLGTWIAVTSIAVVFALGML